jgi:hypothetical protein
LREESFFLQRIQWLYWILRKTDHFHTISYEFLAILHWIHCRPRSSIRFCVCIFAFCIGSTISRARTSHCTRNGYHAKANIACVTLCEVLAALLWIHTHTRITNDNGPTRTLQGFCAYTRVGVAADSAVIECTTCLGGPFRRWIHSKKPNSRCGHAWSLGFLHWFHQDVRASGLAPSPFPSVLRKKNGLLGRLVPLTRLAGSDAKWVIYTRFSMGI